MPSKKRSHKKPEQKSLTKDELDTIMSKASSFDIDAIEVTFSEDQIEVYAVLLKDRMEALISKREKAKQMIAQHSHSSDAFIQEAFMALVTSTEEEMEVIRTMVRNVLQVSDHLIKIDGYDQMDDCDKCGQ